MFVHFTHNIQRENRNDFGFILDSWGDNTMWDALSLQEIMNDTVDGEEKNEVCIIKDAGRGHHAVVIAPKKTGHMRVAVAVHHRWTGTARSTGSSSLGRILSVDLLMHNGGTIRVISSHIPSAITCSCDDVELHLRDLGSLIGGLRRHMFLLGTDPNIHIDEACTVPFITGSASGSA